MMMGSPLDDFLAQFPPEIRDLTLRLRQLILDTIPGMMEFVDPPSKIIAYGSSQKYADLICAIAPFQKHINLMFSRGAQLPDPEMLLAGSGKQARHVKIKSLGDLQHPGVRELLKAAARDDQELS